jgi:hypothetical protein
MGTLFWFWFRARRICFPATLLPAGLDPFPDKHRHP